LDAPTPVAAVNDALYWPVATRVAGEAESEAALRREATLTAHSDTPAFAHGLLLAERRIWTLSR